MPRTFSTSLLASLVLSGLLVPPVQAATPCPASGKGTVIASWFRQLDAAWEHRDAAAAVALFAADAAYREDPFQMPMRGKPAILAYWTYVVHSQRDIRTGSELLSACGNTGIVHWTASFVRVPTGQKVRLDGIAEVTLDTNGRGVRFLEWWNIDQK